ncbi:MAG: RidA family protein [Proteobacteria bacterium]|nr:RidA family protein [Pseudomonadota bacterium]
MKTQIVADGAPAAIGPYSQAIVAGPYLFCSGQIALDPASGQVVAGGVEDQTRRVLENLKAVLEAAGSGLDQVLKTTVFLVDMADFSAMNEVYAQYFREKPPARSTVQVAGLPKDVAVEIEAVALRGEEPGLGPSELTP